MSVREDPAPSPQCPAQEEERREFLDLLVLEEVDPSRREIRRSFSAVLWIAGQLMGKVDPDGPYWASLAVAEAMPLRWACSLVWPQSIKPSTIVKLMRGCNSEGIAYIRALRRMPGNAECLPGEMALLSVFKTTWDEIHAHPEYVKDLNAFLQREMVLFQELVECLKRNDASVSPHVGLRRNVQQMLELLEPLNLAEGMMTICLSENQRIITEMKQGAGTPCDCCEADWFEKVLPRPRCGRLRRLIRMPAPRQKLAAKLRRWCSALTGAEFRETSVSLELMKEALVIFGEFWRSLETDPLALYDSSKWAALEEPFAKRYEEYERIKRAKYGESFVNDGFFTTFVNLRANLE